MPPGSDGTRVRAKIIERINHHKQGMQDRPELIKFRCLINDEQEDVVAYNDIVDYIEQDQTWDGLWKFRNILDHQGPLMSKHPDYKGSSYNVIVEWETGECSWEPLHTRDKTGVFDTDPVTIGLYARAHKLIGIPGWNFPYLKKIGKTQDRIIRHAKKA